MRILLIEDDAKAAAHLIQGLAREGHDVQVAPEGRTGLFEAARETFSVLIIDRMLPGLDGLTLLRTLRAAGVKTPALFLTALGGLRDRLDGLRAGGDDYLVKPFAMAELAARIAALSRRNVVVPKTLPLRIADLELDRLTRTVCRARRLIELKPREYEVLEYLMLHQGQVVTRTMLLEDVWGFHFAPKTTVVEAHISRLRAKLDTGFSQVLIHTCRGAGYTVDAV